MATNWNNIDLTDGYERDLNIIDPLSFDTLLTEISANITEITEDRITAQFEQDLKNRVNEARDIFKANLANIVKYAKNQREE